MKFSHSLISEFLCLIWFSFLFSKGSKIGPCLFSSGIFLIFSESSETISALSDEINIDGPDNRTGARQYGSIQPDHMQQAEIGRAHV